MVGLMHLFNVNGVTSPAMVDFPVPLSTHVQVWEDTWHWLRAGTTATNAELFDWALVGEADHVQRSGWSDGASKSSIHLFDTHYGMSLPGL